MSILAVILTPAIGALLFSMPILSFVLPIMAMRRWRGAWRVAAALAMAPICIDIWRIVTGVARDPTSHNLFPFEMILWSVPGLAFLFLLWLIHLPFRQPGGTA